MQYELDRDKEDSGEPSLAELTEKAIKMLSRSEKGYFLLIEGKNTYLLPSGSEQHEVFLFGSIKEGIFQAPH